MDTPIAIKKKKKDFFLEKFLFHGLEAYPTLSAWLTYILVERDLRNQLMKPSIRFDDQSLTGLG